MLRVPSSDRNWNINLFESAVKWIESIVMASDGHFAFDQKATKKHIEPIWWVKKYTNSNNNVNGSVENVEEGAEKSHLQ